MTTENRDDSTEAQDDTMEDMRAPALLLQKTLLLAGNDIRDACRDVNMPLQYAVKTLEVFRQELDVVIAELLHKIEWYDYYRTDVEDRPKSDI